MSEEARREVLDAESAACCSAMTEIIEEEINVRIALKDDDVHDPEWAKGIAALVADALLNRFVIRARLPDNPLARWVDDGGT